MKLPPSIIERKILVDVPDDYGAYMYRFIDTWHPLLAPYLGIKKDKLPEHGGKFYWGSSENEEFNLLVQGNEKRFILEIIDFRKKEDFNYLQLKEYKMLKEYPNIKTNQATYNLSYGIPPISKDRLPNEEWIKWFNDTRKSGAWDSDEPELVKTLLKLPTFQVRGEDKKSHVTDISAEIDEVGGNTNDMNTVLIFEGVGGKFKDDKGNFFPEGSDIVAGTRHGLMGMKKSKSIQTHTSRVPKEIIEDKSPNFIRALSANDNSVEKLEYKPTFKDVSKLLVELYAETNGKIEPTSVIAKEQVKMTYGKIGATSISKGINRAVTDISTGKRNKKWIYWETAELNSKVALATKPDQLSMYMASGMYDERKIITKFREDDGPNGLKRKKMKVWIHHGEETHMNNWILENSDHSKKLIWLFKEKGFTVQFPVLDHEIDDTAKY